ncbi:hypothetical protein ACFZCY_38585 [Streptomyces sp. NPDC007983]|uniref:hypothetical protein n=1 Tax=Streptomyces sp. NPDC007983 TaxID=3364800 RepID=UPI0036E2819B
MTGRIAHDGQALAVAAELAARFREDATERDARRRLPRTELDRLSASGLPTVTVPAEFGGADVGSLWFGEGVLPLLRQRGLWSHPFRTDDRPAAQVPFANAGSS